MKPSAQYGNGQTSMGRAIGSAIGVSTTAALPLAFLGATATQLREELHLTTSLLGLAAAIIPGTAVLTSEILGRWMELLGPRRSLQLTGLFGSISLLLFPLAQSWQQLIPALIVGGVSFGAVGPASNLFLARHISEKRQGLAVGIKQAAPPAALLLGGFGVPAIALTIGWRYLFILTGIAMLGFAISVPHNDSTRKPTRTASRPHDRPISDVNTRVLLIIALGGGLAAATGITLVAFFVDYSVTTGVSPEVAGLMLAAASAGAFSVRVSLGWFLDRMDRGRLLSVSVLLGVGALGVFGLALDVSWLLVPAALVAFGAGWGWSGAFHSAIVYLNPLRPAAATGTTQTVVFLGATLGPIGFGFIVENSSYQVAWSGLSAVTFAAAGTIVLARRLIQRG